MKHDAENPIDTPLQPGLVEHSRNKHTAWKSARKWACLTLVIVTMLLMGIGIILAGVLPEKNPSTPVLATPTRVKYFQAEEVNWAFSREKDEVWGDLYPEYVNFQSDPAFIVGTIIKGHYVEYTDATFTKQVEGREPGGRWEHLGLLGPPIYAEPGDIIEINLRNMLVAPINLEPMGNSWNIEGFLGPVSSGNTAMFRIHVSDVAGPPLSSAQSSRMYLYRSTVNPTRHENSGLVGPLIVTRKGEANPDGSPKGVDREVVTVFESFNEIETEFIAFNSKQFAANRTDPRDGTSIYTWSTDIYGINGRSFGTLQGLNFKVGEKVRWYVGALGTENGMHNFHWHGNVLEMDGRMMDQITAIPATTLVADLEPDNPGQWLFHCHVNSHLSNGMVASYNVEGPLPPPVTGGREVRYYIAADEVEWDYAPLGGPACNANNTAEAIDPDSIAALYLGEPEGTRIGSKYTKAILREYTDGNFTTLKPRAAGDAYLGLVGPILRAQVGDTIKILFKNQLVEDFKTSLHPHGVFYNKSSEGSPYMDGSSGPDKADDAVKPGDTHEYVWAVPERAGPGPKDPSSLMWMYHSHTDETMDTWAGLAGAMIITAAGTPLNADGSPADVDEERVLFFTAMDETQSLYSDVNIAKRYVGDVPVDELYDNPDFVTSSIHHAINGFMFCNMPKMTLQAGNKVRFHYMSLGDIDDMHTPKMGLGGGFLNMGQREDSIQMSAGGMHSVDVILTEPGTWQLGCNVLSHEGQGLVAMYEVTPNNVTQQANGVTREFFLQAEDLDWDYAPNGYVKCTEMNYSLRSDLGGYLKRTDVAIGSGMYHKAVYREYTDASFTALKPQPDYMGLIGPLMVMEPGDTLVVTLKNTLDFDINFSPGGGLVSTGDSSLGQLVKPGETFRYEWVVPEEAGPTDQDMSSVGYGYWSTANNNRWTHSLLGLEGIMVVVRKGELVQKGDFLLPRDVDYLIPLLWQVFDENLSPFLLDNMDAAGLDVTMDVNDEAFIETNIKHTINGYMYCNLASPKVTLGSRARFVFLSVGATEGLHAPVFTRFPLVDADGAHPSAMLMPGFTSTLDMFANVTGTWPMWCNVHDHMEAGMIASFVVEPMQNA